MIDKAVNVITYAGVLLITSGALMAIWCGFVGVKVAGSGVVLIFTAIALSYCNEEIKLEKNKEGKRENG